MRVKDLMTRKVIWAPVGTPVQAAHQLMVEGGFRHLPVLNARGRVVGIVSDRDVRDAGVVFKDERSGMDEFVTTDGTTVEQIMTPNPVTVAPDTTISVAVKIIRDRRIGCLLVTEEDDLVGILSYLDVLDAADWQARSPQPPAPDDTQPLDTDELRELREQMVAELSEFRTATPVVADSPVDVELRRRRLAEDDARQTARERERAEANQRIIDEIRSQLGDDV